MTTYGSKETFGITVGPWSGQLCEVNIWAGGKNLSPADSTVYLPAFSHALGKAAERIKRPADLFTHTPLFAGLSAEAAFEKLSNQSTETEQAWTALRFVDWGPTTDDFLCFLLPLHDELHLACRDQRSDHFHDVKLDVSELEAALEGAYKALRNLVGTRKFP